MAVRKSSDGQPEEQTPEEQTPPAQVKINVGEKRRQIDAAAPQKREKKKKKKDDEPNFQVKLDLLTSRLIKHVTVHDAQIGYDGAIWFAYENGVWRAFNKPDHQHLQFLLYDISRDVGLIFSKDKPAVFTHLTASRDLAFDNEELDKAPYVAVRNGTLNVATGELEAHRPEHMTTRYVDVDFRADARCPRWIKMLHNVFDDRLPDDREAIVNFLQEWFGVALFGGASGRTPRALRKALFLWGPPRTGKSTILDVLRTVIGSKNIVSASIADITSKFGLASFLNASAWISEEVSGLSKLTDPTRIKCLITGEPLSVNRKFDSDAQFTFNGPVAWASNSAPYFGESSHAIYTRTVPLEVNRVFTEEEAFASFGNMRPEDWLRENGEYPGILVWALKGYQRAAERGQFAPLEDSAVTAKDWRQQNDPSFAFVREYCEYDPTVATESKALAYMVAGFMLAGGRERIPLQSVRNVLRSVVTDVYPQIGDKRRARIDGQRASVFPGLRVTKRGLAYLEKAAAHWPEAMSNDLHINRPATFGSDTGGDS
jgi:P4 family phage/plasmid primase-like protien